MNILNFLRRPRKPATVTKHGLNMAFSVHFDETQYLLLLCGLAPDVLRYPGGTLANYAHVNGNEAGYGLRPDEITNAPGSIHQSMEWQKGERKSAIHEIALVAASLNKPVLWVANIYTGTPEETVQSLGLLIERNVHMAGVEIGNEMYLRRYRYTADQYLREAREHIDAIKHRFPALPCGVVVAPSAAMKDRDSSGDNLDHWNDVVVSSGIGDAHILHAYAPETGTDGHMTALAKHLKTLRKKPVWVTEHGVPGAQQPGDLELMKKVYDGHMDVFRKDGNVQYACLHNGVGGGDGSNAIQCTGRGCGYTPMGWWVADTLMYRPS